MLCQTIPVHFMPTPKITLLMTRPRDAAERFVAQLSAETRARVTVLFSPLLSIEMLNVPLMLQGVRGVIFTSANGVAAASRLTKHRGQPAFCVGRATTNAAKEARWAAEFLGETSDELVAAISGRIDNGPLLHICGRHTRGNIAQRLSKSGRPTKTQMVYEQKLTPLNQSARVALTSGSEVIAPLFSPRTARQFAKDCPKTARPNVIALSPLVADALADLALATLTTASRPDAEAMIGVIETLVSRFCRVESDGGAQ